MDQGERFDLALRVARFDPSPAAVEAAIKAGRLATAPGAEDRVRRLSNLGGLLQTRFQQTGEISYLDEAVAGLRAALRQAVDDDEEASLSNNLGMVLHTKYQHVREWDVLSDAVGFSRMAVVVAPDGPARAEFQRNLAVALSTAFTETQNLDLLEEAIEEAADSADGAGDDAAKGQSLHYVAFLANRWYQATGDTRALDQAIETERQAIGLTPAGSAAKPDRLALLAQMLQGKYELTGERADLAELVDVRRTLVAVTPQGHPNFNVRRNDFDAVKRAWTALTGESEWDGTISPADQAGVRSHHAAELMARYHETGDRAVLDDAVEEAEVALAHTATGHPQRSERLDVLATALVVRAELDGDRSTLAEAVALHREAVVTTPSGHPYESRFLLNLGAALGALFYATGDLAWLAEAASTTRRAADSATRPSERATALANLAALLHRRSTVTGEFALLTEAVEVARESLRLGTDTVAGHADHLTNLGAMMFAVWQRSGRPADLEECIELHESAVEATPERHPRRPMMLGNLGGALVEAFQQFGDHGALNRGISAYRAAVLGCDPALPEHAGYLADLGGALRQRFVGGPGGGGGGGAQDEEALAESIEFGRQAVRASANPYVRAKRLTGLARSLRLRFLHHGDREALAEALAALREAATAPAAPTGDRITAAELWGELAAKADDYVLAAEGFATAVRLLPQLAGRRLAQGDAQYWLGRYSNLAADAAACALAVGNVDDAVTLLELGRGVLAAQAFDGRGDLTDLREKAPELADRFAALSAEVETDTPRDRLQVADELAAVIAEIRALPGLERFLETPLVAELTEQAHEGPVVLVNVSRYRCDALILTPGGVVVQDLFDLTASEVKRRVEAFRAALAVRGEREERLAVEEVVHDTLEWLWDTVTGPVLDRLGLTGGTTRLWWAPVGLLSLLPLHAAGHLRTGGPTVADRVVSSVTPTVRALGHARSRTRGNEPHLLVVAVPEAVGAPKLPGAQEEADHLKGRMPATALAGPDATRDRVLAALPTSTWAHFACHGYSDPDNPADSHLALTDAPLHVLDVSRLRLDHAEFAYLSACDTARASALLSDEAIHPASAFLIAGFGQVVGTLWEINDRLAPRITESIYDDLLAGAPDARRAPFAVHRTVGWIRDNYPGLPSVWAAYVHAGA